ncbi:40S Ribosomal Protein S21 [Manis pentadactyla]|nr:40S Ribosomal Protein S21 [Manis pentadactyla]
MPTELLYVPSCWLLNTRLLAPHTYSLLLSLPSVGSSDDSCLCLSKASSFFGIYFHLKSPNSSFPSFLALI